MTERNIEPGHNTESVAVNRADLKTVLAIADQRDVQWDHESWKAFERLKAALIDGSPDDQGE